MVIRDRPLSLISDQQCAVGQFNYRPHAMETGNNSGELDIRSSSKIEIVVPVAQGKAARFLAQSEERPRKVCAPADGDHDVLAVSIKLKIGIWSRDRILSQWQPRVVLQRHAK